eukprot:1725570-Rhodomonas_salina.6
MRCRGGAEKGRVQAAKEEMTRAFEVQVRQLQYAKRVKQTRTNDVQAFARSYAAHPIILCSPYEMSGTDFEYNAARSVGGVHSPPVSPEKEIIQQLGKLLPGGGLNLGGGNRQTAREGGGARNKEEGRAGHKAECGGRNKVEGGVRNKVEGGGKRLSLIHISEPTRPRLI